MLAISDQPTFLVVPLTAIVASACSQGQPTVDGGLSPTGVAVVYQRTVRPRSMEADGTHLYWAEAAQTAVVLRAPKSGTGPVEPIGTWYGGDVSKRLIAVDATHVFWVENTRVNRWSKADGMKVQIELGDPGSGGWRIIEQGEFLYFTDSRCMKVGRVSKQGGAPTFLEMGQSESDLGGGAYISVDANHIFCGHQSNIWMAPKEGGSVISLAVVPEAQAVGPLVSDGSIVYWSNNRDVLGTDQENLAMVSKAGGPVIDLGTVGSGAAVLRLDASRSRLYWTTFGSGPTDVVFSFSLADRTLTKLAEKQSVFGGMAQDDQYVYWSSDTAIMRVPK